ncbi:LysR substrate-binding domain-containing protein [Aliidiomarina celeris]|uniref:LysR substrate-binding domain-containing protein n=1 Tax=Aliidiomarina celeris TaxID=2249428 RepID=UPI000DEA423E|nr:LysR substrate-binding domain-containing protein [Aliidiomarina celeris]
MQDLTNYALFAHVVAFEGFSAAARELNIPKSTLSRRVSDLEKELGVRLLNRSTRKLSLTDVGREVLVHCQTLIDAAQAAEHVTQRVREKPRGRVRLSSPYAISQGLLVQILPDFMAMYPDVTIDLVTTNQPVNLIEQHIDIALRVRDVIEDSSLIARRILPSPQGLFAHPALLQQFGEPSHPKDLLQWPALSLHQSSGRYQWSFTSATHETHVLSYQARLITDDMNMLKAAAVARQGVVALPNYICRDEWVRGDLVRVLKDWQMPVGILHLVYPHRRGLLPAVRKLIDVLVERMPDAAGAVGIGASE